MVTTKTFHMSYILLASVLCLAIQSRGQEVQLRVDYKDFLTRHDMVWDEIPSRWELAPFTGNGQVGFLFYRTEREGKKIMSIYVGRHDYYDHREAPKEDQMLWIYRGRLPLGHFNLESQGEIEGVDLRLSLWNAELSGIVRTTEGSYRIKGLTHSEHDIIYFETIAEDAESIKVSWHPEEPIPPVSATLKRGGGPKGGSWEKMREASRTMVMPPAPTLSQENGFHYCYQPLHLNRGETTTAWKVSENGNGRQRLIASVHHSFPEHNSKAIVKKNLKQAMESLANQTFFKTHRRW
jgi:hypothetical protein